MDTNNQQTNGRGYVRRPVGAMDGFVRAVPRAPAQAPKAQTQQKQQTPAVPAASQVVTAAKPKKIDPVATAALREPLPLPTYKAPKHPARVVRKKRSWRKLVLKSSGLLVAMVLVGTGFMFWRGYSQMNKVFRGTSTVAALSEEAVDPNMLKGEGNGRVNILLLGVGGEGHKGADLTDTILVLSVDPVNNTAAFLSVPRDLWVKMPVNYFGAYQKINAAYSSAKYKETGKLDQSNKNAEAVQAGFKATDQVLNEVLGIDIHYHMLVNFKAFQQAIDTVGGVTIDVKEQLYDPTMAWENNRNPVLAPVGVQSMDGKKALMYTRSRATSSDFARSERQRQILLGLKDRVLSAGTLSNPTKIDGLMGAFGDNVYSDLSTQGAVRLYAIMKKINDSKVASIGLAEAPHKFVTTDRVGNVSVVRPTAGFNVYGPIQNFVRSQLVDGYILKEKSPITVLAPTVALAETRAAELKPYGYNVTATAAGASAGQATVLVDLSGGKDKYTLHYLEGRYGVKATTKLPAGVTVEPGSAKFVILVGK
jgi:LCP family protein required for cell wall assembly